MKARAAAQGKGQKFITHTGAARIRGICTRTLDRWIKAGIVQPPTVINGRKYHDVEAIESAGAAKRSANDSEAS